MKRFLLIITLATMTSAGFIPSNTQREYSDSKVYDIYYHDIEDYPNSEHEGDHYEHHHFDDLNEFQPEAVVDYHKHHKLGQLHPVPKNYVVSEPKTIHVHEHHHHHHHHVETLPVSIIKKTIYTKLG